MYHYQRELNGGMEEENIMNKMNGRREGDVGGGVGSVVWLEGAECM